MGGGLSKILGRIARSAGGIFGENEQGRRKKRKGLSHVSAMHCKHRRSCDDIERGSSSHCSQNISQQKTIQTHKTT